MYDLSLLGMNHIILFGWFRFTEVATQIKLIVEPQSENELLDMYAQTFMKDYKGEWSLGCKLGWPLLNVFCSTGSCHCHLFFLFGWYCLNFRSPHLDPKQPTPFCLCKEDSPYWWGAILHHNALAHVWCQKGKWSWLPAQSPCTTTERRLAVTTII